MPPCIIRLLSDNNNIKVGLSWHDDIRMLRHRAEFTPGHFIELQEMVSDFGIKDLSLQKLYANIFGQKISKSQRLSNWEADVLTEAQKRYAATDAWACVMLYEEFLRLKREGFELEIVEEEAAPQPPKGKVEGSRPASANPSRERKKKKGTKRKPASSRKKPQRAPAPKKGSV